MHELALINPVDEKNWNNLLLQTTGYSFFHTANWADVLIRSYKYSPMYIVGKTKDSLQNMLPILEVASPLTGRRGVCLPFTDHCPPLAENKDQFQNLIDRALTLGQERKWNYLEIRGGETYLEAQQPSQTFWGHELDLSRGESALYAGLRDSTRRNIKKAQGEKLEIRISDTFAAIKDFCRLNALTRRDHGLPPQPFLFFQNLFDHVIARGMGFVVTASLSGKAIAANVYLKFGKSVIYKYGASDKHYQNLRANNLVMWEAIKSSSANGFQTLHFGRTEPEHHGLLQFKAGWGAQASPMHYYKYDFKQNAFIHETSHLSGAAHKLFSKMPPALLKITGKILYRHMG